MKKLKLCSLGLILFFFSHAASAQRYDSIPRRTLSLNAAASLVNTLVAFSETQYSKDLVTYLPAFQLMFDFTPKYKKRYLRKWELGAMISYEYLLKNNPKWKFYLNGKLYYEDYQDHFKRYNVSLTSRLFYLRKQDLELFSGARVGLTYWEYYNNSRDTSAGYYWKDLYSLKYWGYEVRVAHRNVPVIHGQLILLGARFMFGKNWGANLEACIGAPHVFSLGASYRW